MQSDVKRFRQVPAATTPTKNQTLTYTSFRLSTVWLTNLRRIGLQRRDGYSGIVREALALWAEKEGVDLGAIK